VVGASGRGIATGSSQWLQKLGVKIICECYQVIDRSQSQTEQLKFTKHDQHQYSRSDGVWIRNTRVSSVLGAVATAAMEKGLGPRKRRKKRVLGGLPNRKTGELKWADTGYRRNEEWK
jgi:hypothetical protein